LAKRLHPLMLRRLKQDVVKELPGKIEQVAFCELTGAQRELYEKLHRESRKKLESFASRQKGQARIAMLTALLRLRQACCDLRLLDAAGPSGSAKVDLMLELLEEAIDGGHRVLIFSQFVSMLKILRHELESRDIRFCYLDGATKERAEEVDRFQNSGEIPVFLISLKAGGVGLNLSGADTVVHFDPWWNPAVEDQATDRAFRIGQRKNVFVHKFVGIGTVEERIDAMIEDKKKLAGSIVGSDESWLTELDNDTFKDLIALRQSAIVS
jgi:SNF2 family DNA or RNA helicase